MLYLKCTAHVQKALGLNKLSLHQAQPSQAPLGHWLVNRFDLGNRKALVFMSEPTLLSFILYEGARPLSPITLPQMFLAGLTQLLEMRGFAEKSIADATRRVQALQVFTQLVQRLVLLHARGDPSEHCPADLCFMPLK